MFSVKEHWLWCYWVILLGSLTIIFGIYVLISSDGKRFSPGPRHYSHLPGDDLLQYFLQSAVVSAGMATHLFVSQQNTHDSGIYPSCFVCSLLRSAETFAQTDMAYFIPSRVLVGLGAVCFTLFSIVSILEAGSAEKIIKGFR